MLPPNKPTKTKLLSANSKLDSISYRRDRARPCPQKNHILNQIHGQPQGLSLWGCVNFNIISTVNYHISMTINGGSKPPPYRAKVNLWVLQSLRVAYGNPPPFTQRRLKCGCPYGCGCILIWFLAENYHIFQQSMTAAASHHLRCLM